MSTRYHRPELARNANDGSGAILVFEHDAERARDHEWTTYIEAADYETIGAFAATVSRIAGKTWCTSEHTMQICTHVLAAIAERGKSPRAAQLNTTAWMPPRAAQLNTTAWMLRARELEAELATARVHIAQARAEAAHERLMRSRLAAEIADSKAKGAA